MNGKTREDALAHLRAEQDRLEYECVRRDLKRSLTPIGVCHNCESPVGTGRVVCCDECADELVAARQRRNGEKQ